METNQLRSPICCVLGHVDVGKTTLLDALRDTNVQGHESGGITQQIGATFFSSDYINKYVECMEKKIEVPGLLFIDTPGHDCFTNLRLRGIEIADIAIVIINIVKGVQKQTIECIDLLKKNKTPFIIALNKLDTVNGWTIDKKNVGKTKPINLKKVLVNQSKSTKKYIEDYVNKIIVQMAENEINAAPYYNNPNDREYVSMVPLSATTKEGLPDLLLMISKLSSKYMKKKLVYNETITEGYVMDIYKNSIHGTVINIILTNGKLKRQTNGIFCGNNGPIDIYIKDVYKPDTGKEMKGKTQYESIEEINAAHGVMIKVDNPDDIIPGSKFTIYTNEHEKAIGIENANKQMEKYINDIATRKYKTPGVYLASPSFGPLEALCNYVSNDIDIGGMHIGPINKKLIMMVANNIDKKKNIDNHDYSKQYTVILNYQGTTTKDIDKIADEYKIKIFNEDIIYKLVEEYKKYKDEIYEKIRSRHNKITKHVVFQPLSQYIFRKKNPIVIGVKIINGTIKKNSDVKIVGKDDLFGVVTSIEKNNKSVDEGKQDDEVCIKIETGENKYEYGIDFTEKDKFTNYYSKEDSDVLKEFPNVFDV